MSERPNDRTQTFSIHDENALEIEKALEIKHVMTEVYGALSEKGYNPINQLVEYILSEDPTYITNYKNARALIRRVERDDILKELLKSYLGV